MNHRLKAAFALVFLTPLIAEYLLGSLCVGQLAIFPIMVPMYGCGALLVREVARRSGRGWPAILLLGLAYALIEEGIATQSLFNPHYLGLHLLEKGYVAALGIGGPWTAYVLVLHVIWSIAVPIGFVEALSPALRTTPWLRTTGLVVTGLVYLLGVALIAFGSWKTEHFVASPAQLTTVAVLAVGLIVLTFALARPNRSPAAAAAPAPRPLWFGVLALVVGSIFHLVDQYGGDALSPAASVGLNLVLPLLVFVVAWLAWRDGRLQPAHTDAMTLGALLTYCWLGFVLVGRLHGAAMIPGQILPCGVVLGLLIWLWRQRRVAAVA